GVDAVFGQQVIECRPGHAEKFSRAREVPLRYSERLPDRLRLCTLAGDSQIYVFRVIPRILQAQIACRYDSSLSHDHGALDTVFQLAHVTWPAMRLDRPDSIRRKAPGWFAKPL